MLVLSLPAADPIIKSSKLPQASQIIERALRHQEWQDEKRFEHRFTSLHIVEREGLNRDGEVKWTSEEVYKTYPIGGWRFEELILKDGEPLDKKETKKQERRKREFREDLAKPEKERRSYNKHAIRFNRELMGRYAAETEGKQQINGRKAWVIRYWPKSDNLPVRRRIDHALNHSRGRVWIDEEDYGVLRIAFKLIEPVTFWGGFLGVIRDVDGWVETARFEGGVYLPEKIRLYIDGRILIKSFRQNVTHRWEEFELLR